MLKSLHTLADGAEGYIFSRLKTTTLDGNINISYRNKCPSMTFEPGCRLDNSDKKLLNEIREVKFRCKQEKEQKKV